MSLIRVLGWIVDGWFLNPKIHGILQNVIQVLTWHPQPPLAEGRNHHERKIHAIIITNFVRFECNYHNPSLWFMIKVKRLAKVRAKSLPGSQISCSQECRRM
jgi:hypothetical protein